ncbi:MAG: helix-turn-helix domain-containing protein [Terrimicrobiaceae bacterium]|nr:helix-turn-helix domain-containing protein [Terrimicrobiaceae bacterium]
MERARKKTSPEKKKTRSGKLRTKSEILAALDEMEFSGPTLVAAAENLSSALGGCEKVTLRHFHVPPKTEIQPKEIAAIRRQLNVSQAVFAAYLGVRPASVMSWEYGTRRPSGAALKLLSIVSRNPSLLTAE